MKSILWFLNVTFFSCNAFCFTIFLFCSTFLRYPKTHTSALTCCLNGIKIDTFSITLQPLTHTNIQFLLKLTPVLVCLPKPKKTSRTHRRTNTHKKCHILCFFLSLPFTHTHKLANAARTLTPYMHLYNLACTLTHTPAHSLTYAHTHTRTLVLFIIFCHFNLSTSLLPITETLEDVSLLQLEIIWDTKKRKKGVFPRLEQKNH